jgi:hypothetical protein
MTLKVPIRLTLITLVKASSGNGPFLLTVRMPLPMPAQFTVMRSVPSPAAASRAAVTLSGEVTSPGENTARSPSSPATSLPREDGRSRMTMRAPFACSSFTVARPNPEAPPVTRATLSGISTLPPRRPRG